MLVPDPALNLVNLHWPREISWGGEGGWSRMQACLDGGGWGRGFDLWVDRPRRGLGTGLSDLGQILTLPPGQPTVTLGCAALE